MVNNLTFPVQLPLFKDVLVHPITREPKRCFPFGNIMCCNFTTTNNGTEIHRYAKKTDYLTFPLPKSWRRRKQQQDLIQKEKRAAV